MSTTARRSTRLQTPRQRSPTDPTVQRQHQLVNIRNELLQKITAQKEISKIANEEQDNIEATLTSTNLQDGLTVKNIETLKRQYRKANAKQREIVDGITQLQTELRTRLAELNYIITQERARNRAHGRKRKTALSRKKRHSKK